MAKISKSLQRDHQKKGYYKACWCTVGSWNAMTAKQMLSILPDILVSQIQLQIYYNIPVIHYFAMRLISVISLSLGQAKLSSPCVIQYSTQHQYQGCFGWWQSKTSCSEGYTQEKCGKCKCKCTLAGCLNSHYMHGTAATLLWRIDWY